jgi:hypothetical protein
MLLKNGPSDPRKLTTWQRGKLGELVVAADIACYGFSVAVSPIEQSHYDLIADCGGRLLTIQVKSTLAPQISKKNDKTVSSRYNFSLHRRKVCDLMAFVVYDEYDILYMPREEMSQRGEHLSANKKFHSIHFARQCEGSFERTMSALGV